MVVLTDFQQSVLNYLTEIMLTLNHRGSEEREVPARIRIASGYAFAFYHDLARAGLVLTYPDYMVKHRRLSPADPAFFRHSHILESTVVQASNLLTSAAPSTAKRTDAAYSLLSAHNQPLIGLEDHADA